MAYHLSHGNLGSEINSQFEELHQEPNTNLDNSRQVLAAHPNTFTGPRLDTTVNSAPNAQVTQRAEDHGFSADNILQYAAGTAPYPPPQMLWPSSYPTIGQGLPQTPVSREYAPQYANNGLGYVGGDQSYQTQPRPSQTLPSPFSVVPPPQDTSFYGYSRNSSNSYANLTRRNVYAVADNRTPHLDLSYFHAPNGGSAGQAHYQPGFGHRVANLDPRPAPINNIESFPLPAYQVPSAPNPIQHQDAHTFRSGTSPVTYNANVQSFNPYSPFKNSTLGLGPPAQAPLPPQQPFWQRFGKDNSLYWASWAFELGLSSQPHKCFIYTGGQKLDFWLPCQDDFRLWDTMDAHFLIANCTNLGISVNWMALDSYRTPVQNWSSPTQPTHLHMHQQHSHGSSAGPHHLLSGQFLGPNSSSGFDGLYSDNSRVPAQDGTLWHQGTTDTNLPQLQQPSNDDLYQFDLFGEASFQPSQISAGQQHVSVASPAQAEQSPSAPPNARKEYKRKEYDESNILQPSDAITTTIELLTEEDRREFQKNPDLTWWDPEVDISTVPETDEDQSRYVQVLKEAMLDTSQAMDKESSSSSFNKRWSAEAIAKNGYPASSKEMEGACWELVKMAVELHKEGPGFLRVHDERVQVKLEKEQDLTFEQRINTMVTVLLISKARVDKVLKHQDLGGLVGHPTDLMITSKWNRRHNDKRTEQTRRGKEVLKQDAASAKTATSGTDVASDPTEEEKPDGAEAEQEVIDEGEGDEADSAEEEEDVDSDDDEDEDAGNISNILILLQMTKSTAMEPSQNFLKVIDDFFGECGESNRS